MSRLDQYWHEGYDSTGGSRWIKPCLRSFPDYSACPDYDYTVSYWPCGVRNKKEEAFEILKVLVEEKLVKEPTTFKKFCDLIEKIAETI